MTDAREIAEARFREIALRFDDDAVPGDDGGAHRWTVYAGASGVPLDPDDFYLRVGRPDSPPPRAGVTGSRSARSSAGWRCTACRPTS